jgi:hypothetical protein
MGYTVPVLSEHIKEFCARWKVRPVGVADDAIFAKGGHSRGSISDEFRAAGVTFYPAKKADRISGWQVMRRLLQDAGKPDVPGLTSRGTASTSGRRCRTSVTIRAAWKTWTRAGPTTLPTPCATAACAGRRCS